VEALIASGAIDWPRLIALLTIEPARFCTLDTRGLGQLKAGGPADITLIDPNAGWTIRAAELPGLSKNTPFDRRPVRGQATMTIVNGQIRYELAR
jgi:dihydroorotase